MPVRAQISRSFRQNLNFFTETKLYRQNMSHVWTPKKVGVKVGKLGLSRGKSGSTQETRYVSLMGKNARFTNGHERVETRVLKTLACRGLF